MKEIEIIIYIITIIFLLEKKGINSIINFIVLIIFISVYIYIDINYSYLSFLLIIIYSTAIIILFSFIIMLPSSSKGYYFNSYLPYIILPLSILFFIFFSIENIKYSTSSYLFVPLIGDYLYNSIEGYIFIFIILLLLLLPIPGIFFLLK